MEKESIKKRCVETLLPVRDALEVISGKWRLQIIIAVGEGCEQFSDIQKSVENISPKMLSKELKELEQHKLIVRTVENEYPVKIKYKLDPYADTLIPLIHALRDWGRQHRQKMFKQE